MQNKETLTVRVGRGTLSFSLQRGPDADVVFEPFVVKSGVSMAANLREAFKSADLLQPLPPAAGAEVVVRRVRVPIDSDVMMMPVEQFDEAAIDDLYAYTYSANSHDAVCYDVLPDLNAVAVFAVNRDLRLVLNDHFPDARLMSFMGPVWRHLHQRSFTGRRQKLYAYFHEQRMEVFAFRQNRFRYTSSFLAARPSDALFYLLYVWRQLQMEAEADELHIVGDIPQEEQIVAQLRRFLRNVYVINAAADFSSHPVTAIPAMPYDLMTLHVRGR